MALSTVGSGRFPNLEDSHPGYLPCTVGAIPDCSPALSPHNLVPFSSSFEDQDTHTSTVQVLFVWLFNSQHSSYSDMVGSCTAVLMECLTENPQRSFRGDLMISGSPSSPRYAYTL